MKQITHTQISNDYIDKYMSELPANCTLVFLAIARKTIGWHKQTDRIGYTQLKKLTGLSINTIKKALKTLIEKEIITQEPWNNLGYSYEINYEGMSKLDISNIDSVSKLDTQGYQNLTGGVSKLDSPVYQNLTPQKKRKKLTKETNKRKLQTAKAVDMVKEKSKRIREYYQQRYIDKYHTKPLFTAKENSQIKRLAGIIPEDEIESVIDTYLRNNEMWYVKKTHPIGLLLSDIQKFVTLSRIGKTQISTNEARTIESSTTIQDNVRAARAILDNENWED